MYRLAPTASESDIRLMAAATDGGGYYGRAPTGAWLAGTVTQLRKANATSIKRAGIKIKREYL